MIRIDISETKFVECMEWLHTNFGEGYELGMMNTVVYQPRWEWAWNYQERRFSRYDIRNCRRYLYFQNEDDAIMFKLACL